MTLTILAIVFLFVVLGIAALGFRAIITQGKPPQELGKERCTLCRQVFDKTQLLERQAGDSRLFYFCAPCITKLHTELLRKN
jgi:hypothetical protein